VSAPDRATNRHGRPPGRLAQRRPALAQRRHRREGRSRAELKGRCRFETIGANGGVRGWACRADCMPEIIRLSRTRFTRGRRFTRQRPLSTKLGPSRGAGGPPCLRGRRTFVSRPYE
jgi:hypothetical protein